MDDGPSRRTPGYLFAMLLITSLGGGPGCAGQQGSSAPPVAGAAKPPPPSSSPPSLERGAAEGQHPPHRHRLPDDVVARARLPYHGVTAAGEALSSEELHAALSSAEVVCVGEEHPNPHHHYAQLEILQGLASRAPARGLELGLGLEMFRFPDQPSLDAYSRNEIGEAQLLDQTQFERDWGHDYALYRPLVAFAQRRNLGLIALNAPAELTRSVARNGLAALPEDLEELVPELDLDDSEHRKLFDENMVGHPDTEGRSDRLYAAQVIWDETMAERAARWIAARRPARQLMVVAGMAHCHRTAIPARVQRRIGGHVLSVRPMIQSDDAEPISLDGFDYGLVMGSGAGS